MEKIEVFITRDVLRLGIQKHRACVFSGGRIVTDDGFVYDDHEWHLSRDSAKQVAKAVRDLEVAQLMARVKELKAIRF